LKITGLLTAWATRHIWWTNGVRLVLLGAEVFIRLHAFYKCLCFKPFIIRCGRTRVPNPGPPVAVIENLRFQWVLCKAVLSQLKRWHVFTPSATFPFLLLQ